MGLDNGVCVEFHLDKLDGYHQLPHEVFRLAESIHVLTSKYDPQTRDYVPTSPILNCEMVYWRKWWGVRNEVMLRLGVGGDPYRIDLTTDNIKDMIDVLRYFRNQERWDTEGVSIWYYDDNHIEEQIDIDIYVLESLINIIDNNYGWIESGVMSVYFYDSY